MRVQLQVRTTVALRTRHAHISTAISGTSSRGQTLRESWMLRGFRGRFFVRDSRVWAWRSDGVIGVIVREGAGVGGRNARPFVDVSRDKPSDDHGIV